MSQYYVLLDLPLYVAAGVTRLPLAPISVVVDLYIKCTYKSFENNVRKFEFCSVHLSDTAKRTHLKPSKNTRNVDVGLNTYLYLKNKRTRKERTVRLGSFISCLKMW
jgi:hypothetical protein